MVLGCVRRQRFASLCRMGIPARRSRSRTGMSNLHLTIDDGLLSFPLLSFPLLSFSLLAFCPNRGSSGVEG